MKTIAKYPVRLANEFAISMPDGAVVLSVQVIDDAPWLFVETDKGKVVRERGFFLVSVGQAVPKGAGAFVDTFTLRGDRLTFHLYERAK